MPESGDEISFETGEAKPRQAGRENGSQSQVPRLPKNQSHEFVSTGGFVSRSALVYNYQCPPRSPPRPRGPRSPARESHLRLDTRPDSLTGHARAMPRRPVALPVPPVSPSPHPPSPAPRLFSSSVTLSVATLPSPRLAGIYILAHPFSSPFKKYLSRSLGHECRLYLDRSLCSGWMGCYSSLVGTIFSG